MDLATQHQHQPMFFDQTRRPLPLLGPQRMLHRLRDQPLLLVPDTGALMQRGNGGRAPAAQQPRAQHLAK